MSICNFLNKLNSILIFSCFTLINFIITIFPETIIYTDIRARLIYLILLPIFFYGIFYLLIYRFLIYRCYKSLEKYIKNNSDINDQCIIYSSVLGKRKNENQVKLELKTYLDKHNFQYKFNNIEFELKSFIKYIKKLKKI